MRRHQTGDSSRARPCSCDPGGSGGGKVDEAGQSQDNLVRPCLKIKFKKGLGVQLIVE